MSDISVKPSGRADIFVKYMLSWNITVVQTNFAHNVRITITLFLTYLLRQVPSDVQRFTHITTFFLTGPTW